jgi:hypothetical protein
MRQTLFMLNMIRENEMERKPRLIKQTADLRIYETENLKGKDGRIVRMHLCEELVEGRWEPFYACDRN